MINSSNANSSTGPVDQQCDDRGCDPCTLFSCRSVVNWIRKGFTCVPVYWQVVNRWHPVAPYPALIKDYDVLDERRQWESRTFVNGLFTQSEMAELTRYLRAIHDDMLFKQEVHIPVDIDGGTLVSSGWLGVNCVSDDFYLLGQEPGYNLPFQVSGCFDLMDSRAGRAWAFRVDMYQWLESQWNKEEECSNGVSTSSDV